MPIRIPHASRPGRQQGAVLFIAMVVLVALAIAALALLRSTDVAGLLAGNLAFKRSALNSTELGYQAVLNSFSGITDTKSDMASKCYSATQVAVDSRGMPTVLGSTSTFDTNFPNCSVNGVMSGTVATEKVRYYIDRLCTATGVPGYPTCNLQPSLNLATSTQAQHTPNTVITATYRISVRVDGPRNTTTYTQYIAKY